MALLDHTILLELVYHNTLLSLLFSLVCPGKGVAAIMVDKEPQPSAQPTASESNESPISFLFAARRVASLAWPTSIAQFFAVGASYTSLAFVGNMIGPFEFAAANLGLAVFNAVALYPGFGLCCALDTLCSQEYGRCKTSTKIGMSVKFCMIVCTAFSCLIGYALTFWAESALRLVVDDELAAGAALWLSASMWYLLPSLLAMSLFKFCQNQCIPSLPTVAVTVATVVSPIAHYLMIRQAPPGRGLLYAIGALAFTVWVEFAVIVILVCFKAQLRTTWGGRYFTFDWRSVVEFFKLAAPSLVFVGGEASAFSACAIIAGSLGSLREATFAVFANLAAVLWTTTYGVSVATSARVGNALGAGSPQSASRFVFAGLLLTAILASCQGITFGVIFHRQCFRLFVSDDRVLDYTSTIFYLFPFYHFLDCTQFMFQGILSGCGKNDTGGCDTFANTVVGGHPGGCVFIALLHSRAVIGVHVGDGCGSNVVLCVGQSTQHEGFGQTCEGALRKNVARYSAGTALRDIITADVNHKRPLKERYRVPPPFFPPPLPFSKVVPK